jgi:FkbM family methyltransferase
MTQSLQGKLRTWLVDKSFQVPQIRGIHRLAISIGKFLTNDDNCITFGTLKNGYVIKLDLKSPDQRSLYYLRSYEDDLVEYFRSILSKNNSVFIDVGASIGVFTLSVADLMTKTNGRIIAFEPFKSNHDYLAESIILNQLQDTVQLHRKAVGHEKRIVKMRIDECNAEAGNALISEVDPREHDAYEVCEMVIMDDFLEGENLNNIAAVKMDIEGWEYFAIKGFTRMIEKHRPIIYGEFLQSGMTVAGITKDMIQEMITTIDYEPYILVRKRLVLLKELPNSDRLDIILVPKEKGC